MIYNMKKDIKTSTLKKIVVKCADFWMDELEIDSEIFDDVYVEAATRAIEKRKDLPGFKVTVILDCWEKKDFKKPEKHFCYNTYRVLINAALHDKAEMLRINFMKMHGIDLQKESLKGENGNTTNQSITDPNTDGK
jgi:predicted DNA-binding ArsR family transcriptional regulator